MENLPKLNCVFCNQIVESPVNTDCCNALACWECFLQASNCVCGAVVQAEKCRPNVAIQDFIDNLRRRPTQRSVNSSPSVSRSARCANAGCLFEGTAVQMEKHYNECSQRRAKCKACSELVSWSNRSEHANVCPEVQVSCPQTCGATFLRKNLQEHIAICEFSVVDCPYHESGCYEKLTRRDLDEHLNQNVHHHMQLMQLLIKGQQNEIETLKQQLEEKERQIPTQPFASASASASASACPFSFPQFPPPPFPFAFPPFPFPFPFPSVCFSSINLKEITPSIVGFGLQLILFYLILVSLLSYFPTFICFILYVIFIWKKKYSRSFVEKAIKFFPEELQQTRITRKCLRASFLIAAISFFIECWLTALIFNKAISKLKF